jgi:hypothetical protein
VARTAGGEHVLDRGALGRPDHGPGTALPSAAVSTHAGRLLVPSPSPSLAEATRPTWSAARKPGLFFLGRLEPDAGSRLSQSALRL